MAVSSNWAGLPMARSKPISSAQRKSLLGFFDMALLGIIPAADAALIVNRLVYLIGFIPPRWKDLSPVEKLDLEMSRGFNLGIEISLSFNISDQQRIEWVKKYSNITKGFKKEVLHHTRHMLGPDPMYWLVVEPNVSKGGKAKHYKDAPGAPRRFGVHAGILLQHGTMNEFLLATTDKAPDFLGGIKPKKMTLKFSPIPIGKGHRVAYYNRAVAIGEIKDTGWGDYSTKVLDTTMEIHTDVTGKKPIGASRKLNQEASQIYEKVRKLAEDIVLTSAIKLELDPHGIAPKEKAKLKSIFVYNGARKQIERRIQEIGLPSTLEEKREYDRLVKLLTPGKQTMLNVALRDAEIVANRIVIKP